MHTLGSCSWYGYGAYICCIVTVSRGVCGMGGGGGRIVPSGPHNRGDRDIIG